MQVTCLHALKFLCFLTAMTMRSIVPTGETNLFVQQTFIQVQSNLIGFV